MTRTRAVPTAELGLLREGVQLMQHRELHIFVLDGSRSFLDVVHEVLEEEGFRVSSACQVPTDPADIRDASPDLVLMDLYFDGRDDGWSLLKRIREDARTATLPVVVCTGATGHIRQHARELGVLATDVILKPFDVDELVESVEWALKRRI